MNTFPYRLLAASLAISTLIQAESSHKGLEEDVVNDFEKAPQELLHLDDGNLKIGIDRAKGAAITFLSWKTYPKNTINEADPGRLIQQSYYAGADLERKADGQHAAWSPWPWNPIQGGGVGSWAQVPVMKLENENTLYSKTIPKLWDMADEEASAVIKQWTSLEKKVPRTVRVRCLFESFRREGDRWGPAKARPQEVPACYFTRNFAHFQSYLGEGNWRDEKQDPGPPWGQASPPRLAMACFEPGGQGVAIFSPTAGPVWNFGPHAGGMTTNPKAGPCIHIAPLSVLSLEPRMSYQYRYWLTVGTREEISQQLDLLWEHYGNEQAKIAK